MNGVFGNIFYSCMNWDCKLRAAQVSRRPVSLRPTGSKSPLLASQFYNSRIVMYSMLQSEVMNKVAASIGLMLEDTNSIDVTIISSDFSRLLL